jgi:hypothetical protein
MERNHPRSHGFKFNFISLSCFILGTFQGSSAWTPVTRRSFVEVAAGLTGLTTFSPSSVADDVDVLAEVEVAAVGDAKKVSQILFLL